MAAKKKKKKGSKIVKVLLVLFLLLVLILGGFALGVYLESLSVFANTFSYSQTKANHVVERLNQNDEAVKELQTWFDGEYD